MRISGQSIIAGIAPQNLQGGRDPAVFQGLDAGGAEGAFGYSVPNLLIDHAMRNPHVPPGFWRGVNVNQNAIYIECFIDEVAQAAGQDPLEFRRELLSSPKQLAVLNAVGREGAAGASRCRPGISAAWRRSWAMAATSAACAEVSVSPDGALKIHKITAATDPGHAVNPQQIERRSQGSFVYGLSAALYGEIPSRTARVEQTNFDTYNVMRMDEMPKVETIAGAVGRLLGRRRRADHRGGRAGGAERDLQGDRQAHPRPAADAPGAEEGSLTRPPVALFLKLMATAGLAPAVVSAQGAAKVVVVGGGFAGAACARALAQARSQPRRHAGRGGQDLQRLPVQQLGDRRPARAGAAGIRLRRPRRGRRARGDRRGRRRRSGGAHRGARRRRHARLRPAGDRAGRRHELDGDRRATPRRRPRRCRTPGPAGRRPLLLRRQLEAMADGGAGRDLGAGHALSLPARRPTSAPA